MMHSVLLGSCEGLLHAYTDREGGNSAGPYASRNLAYHVGDAPATVDGNQQRLAARLAYDPKRLIHMRQIHSDLIVRCTPEMDFDSRPECDAIMTDIPGQPLMVMVADCTPILLVDPARRAIAAVHAGRAGALKNIVGKTVAAMRQAYGTDPADLLAALGPSIHACCYEIGPEIAREVAQAGHAYALQKRDGSDYLDVNRILTAQLLEAGVCTDHIDETAPCTACRNDRFFSYRADGGTTGRQAGIIMLK